MYFVNVVIDGSLTNKSFWNFIKPFMKNKNCQIQNDIMLIQNDKIITEEKDLAWTFNNHYINIVKKVEIGLSMPLC